MSGCQHTFSADGPNEVSELVETLRRTEERLQELMEDQVDSVLLEAGQSFMLRKAREELRASEECQRTLANKQMAILNALPAHIALLDPQGTIVSVNESWINYAYANQWQTPDAGVGQNYLAACDRATGVCSDESGRTAAGIRAVLDGTSSSFSLEYPCHSPTEKLWFQLMVNPLVKNSRGGAVIMHVNITDRKIAEEELMAKTALFEAVVDSSVDGILVVDQNWKKVLQNQRLVDIWGIPDNLADDIDDKPQFEWVATQVKDAAQFVQKSRYLFDHPDELSHDELELKNGKCLERYSAPVLGKEGRYYGRIWTLRDVTERKQSELALQQSEERFRSIFSAADTGIAISTPQGRFLTANPAYCSMLGYTEDELKERDFASLTHQDDLAHNLTLRDELLAGLRDSFIMEKRYLKKDGTIVWARLSVSASRSAQGEVTMMIVVAEDYTERRRTEARFRRLVESNAQGVIFWNVQGDISDANDAFLRLTGYTREDLQAGRLNWVAMTPPEFAEANRRAVEELAAKGTCAMFEKEFIRKDGARVPILIGGACFEDKPDEGVAFVLDLTERKKFERQYLRAQRMESVGTLASGIAHDLNNVLAPILMSIELLKYNAKNDSDLKLLETLQGSARRGADLVKQVLSFGRCLEGERVVVNPIHIMRDLLKVMRDTFPKSIDSNFKSDRDLWTMMGDPTQLHQVLLNLCVNARDALPNGGTISVGMENSVLDDTYAAMNPGATPGSFVMIKVEDNGTGIPPEIREQIFEPFFTTKEVGKGTGLGLATTMAIVKSHGGFINLYSEVGVGTKFKIYFPANTSKAAAEDVAVEQTRLPRGNGEMILLVDDEEAIRNVAQSTLERFGYRVLLAANGAEAVAVYAQHRRRIDIVLTDMAMPIMDGPSLIVALKAINPQVLIIGSSGLASNGGVAKALGAGVQLFVPKPYTAETMLITLQKALEGKNANSRNSGTPISPSYPEP